MIKLIGESETRCHVTLCQYVTFITKLALSLWHGLAIASIYYHDMLFFSSFQNFKRDLLNRH